MNNLQDSTLVKPQPHDSEVLLAQILDRLCNILRDENSRLETGVTEDHGVFIMSKNLVLRELMAMQRTIRSSLCLGTCWIYWLPPVRWLIETISC